MTREATSRQARSARDLSSILAAAPDAGVRSIEPPIDELDPIVSGVAFDSRAIAAGSMFFAIRGGHNDGHEFAATVAAAGAAAIIVDHSVAVGSATQVVVGDTRIAMGHLSAAFFDNPSSSLRVVGITGTNGKTTTAHIVAGALEALGERTGVIGTLSGAHTTPEAPELQQRLADFRDDGYVGVAMEVSSHALALDRVVGTHFAVGVFTNLGRDHLDLHGTQERYFAAKARLFEPTLTDVAVVNIDDMYGRLIADAARIPVATFTLEDAADVALGPFAHSYTWRGVRVQVGLGGRFNVMNSLAAATTLSALGHAPGAIATALATTSAVRGRFEPVDAGQGFVVVVDYAHTPDALGEVLTAAREIAGTHRVSVVFGCGGDRDRVKRPLMGNAAAQIADHIVVTSDNPRSEDPLAIINDIIEGVPGDYRGVIASEPDRHDAIAAALHAASPGDVVVIAGKGHETTQTFSEHVVEFDDRAVARELLEAHA